MKGNPTYSYTYKDFYKDYEGSLDYKTFKLVVIEVFKEIFNALLAGRTVYLPYRMGRLEIVRYKPTTNTLAYGTLEEQENLHTDGYKIKLRWKGAAIKNRRLTQFKFVSTINKKISKLLREDGSLIYNFNIS